MSGWKLSYVLVLGFSLYVAFGGPLPANSIASDVSHMIRHAALR